MDPKIPMIVMPIPVYIALKNWRVVALVALAGNAVQVAASYWL